MDCELKLINNIYVCKNCGWKTKLENVHRNCPNKPKNTQQIKISPYISKPNDVKRIFNFGKAIAQHVIQGSPKSSQEQINDRLEICRSCPLFQGMGDVGVCTHESCGCNLSRQQIFMNKLAWKDQQCPINKWEEVDKKYEV